MIWYTDDLASVREDMLRGFFGGWARRSSAGQYLAVLRGSHRSVAAIDEAGERMVGYGWRSCPSTRAWVSAAN